MSADEENGDGRVLQKDGNATSPVLARLYVPIAKWLQPPILFERCGHYVKFSEPSFIFVTVGYKDHMQSNISEMRSPSVFCGLARGKCELTAVKRGFIVGAYRAAPPVDQGLLLLVSVGDQIKDFGAPPFSWRDTYRPHSFPERPSRYFSYEKRAQRQFRGAQSPPKDPKYFQARHSALEPGQAA